MQRPSTATLAAWTVTDGHAGNSRQATALADALALQSRGMSVHAQTLQPRAPWRWLAPRRMPGAAHAFGDGFADALSDPPALAIGCGRQAALATRLLRARGAKAVQILDPRVSTRHWDLVIAPEHDALSGPNVLTLLGSLHPVDDLWLAAARRDFAALAKLPQPRTALLLGGASTHAAFDTALFGQIAAQIGAAVAREGGSVLATTSRRTPEAVKARLRERFIGIPGVVWTGSEGGENPYPGLLGWADRIVCTADSVNMLSEACATDAPVFAAGIERVRGRPKRFLESLLSRDRLRPLDGVLADYPVVPLRETARIAEEVKARLHL
ncbi:mitochondrial fission ELM1 family protein [Lysobacter sp. D1-1-M9]|uniref:mitochondrial fission ELM1 family protein n=2 Tax=Novilysobacter TaxID=3382699 RepID=UPI002FC63103